MNSKKHLIETVLYTIEDGEDCKALLDLINNADIYRWHDLREDLTDLPMDELVICSDAEGRIEYGQLWWSEEGFLCDADFRELRNVVAWKYVEPFEVQDDN